MQPYLQGKNREIKNASQKLGLDLTGLRSSEADLQTLKQKEITD
jgi:hypothetical protein